MKKTLYSILTFIVSMLGKLVGTIIKTIRNFYNLSRNTFIIAFPYIIVSLSIAWGVYLLLGWSFLGIFFLLVGVFTLIDLRGE